MTAPIKWEIEFGKKGSFRAEPEKGVVLTLKKSPGKGQRWEARVMVPDASRRGESKVLRLERRTKNFHDRKKVAEHAYEAWVGAGRR